MTTGSMLLRRAGALALALACAPAAAQMIDPRGTPGPADDLARYLRVLTVDPRDLNALLGAGKAALDVGDANAAVGFFARADQISPRNGRVKAGLGTALVLLERPRDALKRFDDATDLGVSEASIASDRGLAYDLLGDSRRAQKDYQLALRDHADPEATRRLALSLGISGDRDKALKLLDPLLRQRDPAGWRARAFVLAMTGDRAGAASVVSAMMPRLGPAMSPFLARLASLPAGQKAAAVNFGHIPATGTAYAAVQTAPALLADQRRGTLRADSGLIPTGKPLGPEEPADSIEDEATVRMQAPVSRESRRRPGQATPVASATASPSTAPQRIVTVQPTPRSVAAAPVRTASVEIKPRPSTVRPGFSSVVGAAAAPSPTIAAAPAVPRPVAGPPASLATTAAQTTPAPPPASAIVQTKLAPSPPPPSVTAMTHAQREDRLAAIMRGIDIPASELASAAPIPAKPDQTRARTELKAKAAADAKTKAATEAKVKAATEAKAKATADVKAKTAAAKARAAPSRDWVQVAGGANKGGLPAVWKKLKDGNATLFAGKSAWTVPLKSTNRLLVGPFKSAGEAQAFVNQMGKAGLSGFTFTSDEGQEIGKLVAK